MVCFLYREANLSLVDLYAMSFGEEGDVAYGPLHQNVKVSLANYCAFATNC